MMLQIDVIFHYFNLLLKCTGTKTNNTELHTSDAEGAAVTNCSHKAVDFN